MTIERKKIQIYIHNDVKHSAFTDRDRKKKKRKDEISSWKRIYASHKKSETFIGLLTAFVNPSWNLQSEAKTKKKKKKKINAMINNNPDACMLLIYL